MIPHTSVPRPFGQLFFDFWTARHSTGSEESNKLRQNHIGTAELRWSVLLGQEEDTQWDAQKGDLLTLPTLARQDAPCPRQGRSSEADPRFTIHASRFTVLGSEARTKLEDFFSILLSLLEVKYRSTA